MTKWKRALRRQCDSKLSEESFFWVKFDDASELGDEILSDVQAETDTISINWFVLLLDFAEKFEHIALVQLINSNARVKQFKLNSVYDSDLNTLLVHQYFLRPDTDLNVSFKSEFRWVSQDIDQYLLQSLVVTFDHHGNIFSDRFDQKYILL